MNGFYLHIPFCHFKCPYCDFNSYAGQEEQMAEYIQGVLAHMKQARPSLPDSCSTAFIGGGTPTLLPVNLLEQLLDGIRTHYPEGFSEFTIEANPATLTDKKLSFLKLYGVNRVSIGLQAWQNELLALVGRTHTREDFLHSVALVREAGISNINADVMYQLPGQTMEQWQETIEALLRLELPHISCYALTIAPGTPFAKHLPAPLPDEETEREMNHFVKNRLEEFGIFRYEISNYAKPGFLCQHNLIYWHGQSYAAFGAGASGFLNGIRFGWPGDPALYAAEALKGTVRPVWEEKVEDLLGEQIMLSLRLTEGVSRLRLEEQFGVGCLAPYRPIIRQHLQNGLLQITDGGFALTDRGFDFANQVMCDFL